MLYIESLFSSYLIPEYSTTLILFQLLSFNGLLSYQQFKQSATRTEYLFVLFCFKALSFCVQQYCLRHMTFLPNFTVLYDVTLKKKSSNSEIFLSKRLI